MAGKTGTAMDMPDILIDAASAALNANGASPAFIRSDSRAVVVAVLRALAGPEHSRDNHVLMTGNILHTLADLTEESTR